MKWLRSPFFVPGLFILWHYKLWMGIQTFGADTGDGIGAFKFFSIFPNYWNWYEAGGQPYWTEMAIYRLQDPLMWPFLLLLKALPVPVLVQFNLYILLRLCLVGIGTFLFLRSLKVTFFSAQMGTLLTMFGSAVPVMFRSIGALDIVTAFLGCSLFGSLFSVTKERKFLCLLLLVLLHSSITYHILYLIPLALLSLPLMKNVIEARKTYKREVLLGFFAVTGAFLAEYVAVKDPFLLPVLRSVRYGTWVDDQGKVVGKEIGVGESILSNENLKAQGEDCGTRFSCRAYQWPLLKTFLLKESAWSLTGYVSLLGLLLLPFSLFYLKNRSIRYLLLFSGVSFLLSLGNQTWVWRFAQRLIFPLQYVRHTGFYFHLFVFLTCLVIALTLNALEGRISKSLKPILFIIVLIDLLAFNRLYVSSFLNFTKDGQSEKISTTAAGSFSTRVLRHFNPYLIPRTSVATTYGVPSALESIFVQDEITPDHLKRGENSLYFGFITLFMSKPLVETRVKLGTNIELFKERLGIEPFSVLSGAKSRNVGFTIKISGEELHSRFSIVNATPLYLAVPLEAIHSIRINGRPVPFTSSSGGYGVLFTGDKGENTVTVIPKLGRRNLIYCLYYGAYLLAFFLLTQPEKFLSRILRETSFSLSDLLSRTRVSKRFFT